MPSQAFQKLVKTNENYFYHAIDLYELFEPLSGRYELFEPLSQLKMERWPEKEEV